MQWLSAPAVYAPSARLQKTVSITLTVAANIVRMIIKRSCASGLNDLRDYSKAANAAVGALLKIFKAELIWRRSWATRRQAEMASTIQAAVTQHWAEKGRFRTKRALNK